MRGIGKLVIVVGAVGMLFAGPAMAQRKPVADDSRVYIIWPKDGQIINGGKFWVRMGARNVGVAPAGVIRENTGHHHFIIDSPLPPMDEPIPNDPNNLHFGKGQTEVRLELPPGRHTLQMLMGDDLHIPHATPLFSQKITIIVPEQ